MPVCRLPGEQVRLPCEQTIRRVGRVRASVSRLCERVIASDTAYLFRLLIDSPAVLVTSR